MIFNLPVVLMVAVLVSLGTSDKVEEGPLLSTFREVHQDVQRNTDGTYQFSFSLPQQERQEQRDEDGKVTGYYAFVDNSGEEFSLHFEADEGGFQPESDDLPEAPEDTEDVQTAREEFLRYYEQTAKFLERLASGEDSDSDSDSDEDSDSSSSEEDYEDSSSSSEEDDDEEEEEEEDEENTNDRYNFFSQRNSNRRFGARSRRPVTQRSNEVTKQTSNDQKSVFPSIPSFPSFGRRT